MVWEYAKGADVVVHECMMAPEDAVLKYRFLVGRTLEVFTQIHTAPEALGKIISEVKPRLAIAYHFFYRLRHNVKDQVSHDDKGNILGEADMEVQMRTAYANIGKVLAQYGATLDNVVDEMLFVTDMDAAFAARVKMKLEVFSGSPVLGSTIVQIQRLALPQLMIEIRCIARV